MTNATATPLSRTFNLAARATPSAVNAALPIAQVHAQVAVAVELYTIPLYLSACASINSAASANALNAYNAVLSVCIEEMMHLQLAANMCLALGTTPNFTAPVYGQTPAFPDGTPILDPTDPATGDSGILNASIGNIVQLLPTMLDIEVPTEFESGALLPPYHSIGQMYDALVGLARLSRSVAPWTLTNQVSNLFATQPYTQTIGSFNDLVTAVGVICEQGEGKAQSPPPQPPYTASQFMIPDANDQLAGSTVDSAPLNTYSHFGRFLTVQSYNLSGSEVYTGTAAPGSTENLALQSGFASLITTMNSVWAGTTPSSAIWAMTSLLGQAQAVWKAGNIPQWTPVS
ncbi:MAG TPA: ferritin-like domain-containing protein [Rhodanobacteraceae bacterium]|nr:ferritin-like domain-containing protein [Rhodanobacteraceae bacterium]